MFQVELSIKNIFKVVNISIDFVEISPISEMITQSSSIKFITIFSIQIAISLLLSTKHIISLFKNNVFSKYLYPTSSK